MPTPISSTLSAVETSPARVVLTDRSGSAGTSNSATTAVLNTDRKFLLIQNNHATQVLWYNFGTAAVATQPSIQLAAGQFHKYDKVVPTGGVNVIASGASTPYTLKEA